MSGSVRSIGPSATRFRERLLPTKLVPLPVPGGYFELVDNSAASGLDVASNECPLHHPRSGAAPADTIPRGELGLDS